MLLNPRRDGGGGVPKRSDTLASVSAAAEPLSGRGVRGLLRGSVERLPGSSFAIVMATGILSVGLALEGLAVASVVMLVVAVICFVTLVVMTAWRAVGHRDALAAEIRRPSTAFGFFTFVAAVQVLGTRFASVTTALALVLLVVGFLAWVVMGYAVPWSVLSHAGPGEALAGLNGGWFVWSVASQSIAVLAAVLEPRFAAERGGIADVLAIVAISAWGIGIAQYGIIGVAVVIRMLTRGIAAVEFDAPYWVMMGASAITVLAASRIVDMSETPMVLATRPVIAGSSVVFWAFASWLVPALVLMGWWRHVQQRVPLRYETGLWAMVFPLGMYAVASMDLGQADRLPVVTAVGSWFLWIAAAAWIAVAVAGVLVAGRAVARAMGTVRPD